MFQQICLLFIFLFSGNFYQSENIELFLDSIIRGEMEKYHIPGLSLCIVKDSSILYTKGYGYADINDKTPVSPEESVFFTGSVTKLFTATGIMQLYEKGKLDLEADISRYLGNLSIEQHCAGEVTIENLLSHTGGFEERNIGMAALSAEEMLTLEEFIALGNQPGVLPPGKYISYSNYGYTLLGYIVEKVSGLQYEEYIEKNILSPLDMHSSSAGYRKDIFSKLAPAWVYSKEEYTELPIVYLNVAPAGALMCTAEDISKFMIAHLNQGSYKGSRILKPETLSLMHSRLFTAHPRLPGFCHGFYERFVNDERIIEHAGDIHGYSSLLSLIPDKKLGIYMVYNGGDRMIMGFREKVIEDFVRHYFPRENKQDLTSKFEITKSYSQKFSGTYKFNRYARLSPEKLISAIMELKLKANEDLSLTLEYPAFMGVPSSNWKQVDSLLFYEEVKGEYMSFEEDEKGKISHMNMSMGPPANFEKSPWYSLGKLHLALLILFFPVFLMIVPGWLIARMIGRIRKKQVKRGIPDKRTRRLAISVSSLNLLFLIGLPATVAAIGEEIIVSVPWFIKILPVIPVISILLWIALIYYGNRTRGNHWKPYGRIQYLLLLVTSFLFYWSLNYWNLLGFHF